jgi:DNA polymerase III subunit epsilon
MGLRDDSETMATTLEATGDYRILRRLRPRERFCENDGGTKKVGIILDVETTGLDSARDEIIELAMVKFEFAADGRIFRVLDIFDELREPSIPIPPEITAITGITPDDVAGHSIDPLQVAGFADQAAVIIAHNAGFDRKFCERAWTCFTTKAWACSVNQIDWRTEGFEGSRLGYLLAGCGLFHDGHRAAADCAALMEVLSRPLLKSGEPALKRLLDNARRATARVWAQNSPFEKKDALKARGYRWNDGSDGRPKAWWTDVAEDQLEAELTYLRKDIYGYEADVPWTKITAFDRFSVRV